MRLRSHRPPELPPGAHGPLAAPARPGSVRFGSHLWGRRAATRPPPRPPPAGRCRPPPSPPEAPPAGSTALRSPGPRRPPGGAAAGRRWVGRAGRSAERSLRGAGGCWWDRRYEKRCRSLSADGPAKCEGPRRCGHRVLQSHREQGVEAPLRETSLSPPRANPGEAPGQALRE